MQLVDFFIYKQSDKTSVVKHDDTDGCKPALRPVVCRQSGAGARGIRMPCGHWIPACAGMTPFHRLRAGFPGTWIRLRGQIG
ncbi:uncharacterized protein FOKN1_0594 [Thiohalobacter thiocyanaticus]|uniref:Uncharacterized protein n=1 Tax=Thiohalobacter thiocyanaticus TaxID=585455 RepID=A0A1Z4VMZ6_9GAMM|nr:uncharacterized protein FOKN1_0594 [Thiohalobacter thiocyanaticus]